MLSSRLFFIALTISFTPISDSFGDSQYLQTEFYYQGKLTRKGLIFDHESQFQGQMEDHDTILVSERDNLGRKKNQDNDTEFDTKGYLFR